MLGSSDLVGIDIGKYAIKLARVKKSGKSFICNFLAYEPIPEEIRSRNDSEALKKLLANLIKHYKLGKSQMVIHLHAGDVIMREVHVDASFRGDALEGAVELDLGPALPFGIEQVYFDFTEQPDEDGNRLAVAARRDLVDPRTALFSSVGKSLPTVQVDVDVFAFERLVESLGSSGEIPESTILIADIGLTRCRFMVYQNARYVFHREQQIGGQQVNEIIADIYDFDLETAEERKLTQELGSEYEEIVLTPYVHSLAEQINLASDFYEASGPTSTPIEKVYLVGGGANLAGLELALQDVLDTPVSILDLSSHVKLQSGQPSVLKRGLNNALAIGLAMEGK